MDVEGSYNAVAEEYLRHLFLELLQKPLDRHLLNRFAEAVRGRGPVVDLGCGPGHVAKYLQEQGVTMTGIDLAPAMVRLAAEQCPLVEFRVGDMRQLALPDTTVAGIVAFYSIVHFTPEDLHGVFAECRRVLTPEGVMLLGFHRGDEVNHVEELWGVPVSLDFRFHLPAAVEGALRGAGFDVIEWVERAPYPGVEYPSRRCYLLARVV